MAVGCAVGTDAVSGLSSGDATVCESSCAPDAVSAVGCAGSDDVVSAPATVVRARLDPPWPMSMIAIRSTAATAAATPAVRAG